MLEDKPPDFTRVASFRQGYAVHQVDALVSRIRAELRRLQAQQVETPGLSRSEFDAARLQTMAGGYRRAEVEKYLAEASTTLAAAMTPQTTASITTNEEQGATTAFPAGTGASVPRSLSNPVFNSPGFGRHGYATGSVDYLVSLIAQGLAGTVEMTGAQLAQVTFGRSPTPSSGYDESEVDAYLEAVIAELDRRQSNGNAT